MENKLESIATLTNPSQSGGRGASASTSRVAPADAPGSAAAVSSRSGGGGGESGRPSARTRAASGEDGGGEEEAAGRGRHRDSFR